MAERARRRSLETVSFPRKRESSRRDPMRRRSEPRSCRNGCRSRRLYVGLVSWMLAVASMTHVFCCQ
jgi:hypothetical protein